MSTCLQIAKALSADIISDIYFSKYFAFGKGGWVK
jgi:hypothetical protein